MVARLPPALKYTWTEPAEARPLTVSGGHPFGAEPLHARQMGSGVTFWNTQFDASMA